LAIAEEASFVGFGSLVFAFGPLFEHFGLDFVHGAAFECPLSANFVGSGGDPSNMVLFEPLNEVYALKYVSNIIYPTFLDLKVHHCLIEIQALVFSIYQEENELFGELN
jgi:hypothetical protein